MTVKVDKICPKSDMRTQECNHCVLSCLQLANKKPYKYNHLRQEEMRHCSKFAKTTESQ